MSTFGEDLIQAMGEGLVHAKGEGPATLHEPVDQCEVRMRTKLTQHKWPQHSNPGAK